MNSKLKWKILIILSTIWFLGTVLYPIFWIPTPESSTKSYELFKFIFLSISAYGVIFSALLASFNSLESSYNIKERIEFDKKENSFHLMERWDSESIKDARDITRKLKSEKKDMTENELIKRIEGPYKSEDEIRQQENLKRSVITMFNFFEEIYLSIDSERINQSILKTAFGTSYIDIFERFKCWLKEEKYMSKKQYENLDKLRKKWES